MLILLRRDAHFPAEGPVEGGIAVSYTHLEIKQDLTDYGDTMINQIIMGIEPLEKFDEMVDYFEQNGALEMEQIYNDAEQTYQEMNGN